MKTIYLATYEGAKEAVQKALEEATRKESMLVEALSLLEEKKHYKQITKKSEVESEKFYSYTQADYSFKVKFVLTNRIWKTTEPDKNGVSGTIYLDDYEENLYFSPEEERTPLILMQKIEQRLEGLRTHKAKIEKELANFKNIYNKACELAGRVNAFQEQYSYITLRALEI